MNSKILPNSIFLVVGHFLIFKVMEMHSKSEQSEVLWIMCIQNLVYDYDIGGSI